MKSVTDNLGTVALLGACCMFLSLIEHVIPKPMPFFRIGLANLPILIAVTLFPAKRFFLLILLKVIGQGLIAGTLFSYVFLLSAGGSFASGLVMYACARLGGRRFSLIGIGVLGSLASTITQLIIASTVAFGPGARYIAPPFLLAGLLTGAALGVFGNGFIGSSKWYAEEARLRGIDV